MAGALLLVVVIIRGRWRWAARIRTMFAAPGSSVDLAVTRIVFFTVALVSSNGEEAARLAALPSSLRTYPVGSSLIYQVVGPSPQWARAGAGIMVVCAAFAMVGLWTRAAGLTWVLLATYVNGIPQLFGKVDHGHHLIWFGAILALSRCGDALSVDAWRRRISPQIDVRYGFPIRLWWLLLGLVYFFPGLWKIVTSGVHWVSPENIRSHMFAVWAGLEDFSPVAPVHRWPVALVALGVFTIVFELGFVVAVFTRARWAWVAMGVAFHVGTLLIMNIQFSSLIVCYAAIVPWSRLLVLEPGTESVTGTGTVRTLDMAGSAAALMLVAAVAAFGSLGLVNAWPISAYPLFDSQQGPLYATSH
jgi:hypothetical protein